RKSEYQHSEGLTHLTYGWSIDQEVKEHAGYYIFKTFEDQTPGATLEIKL
ncbi:20654_t:CDS:1, partial [Racocetra persica]